jgi:hypothetical protein
MAFVSLLFVGLPGCSDDSGGNGNGKDSGPASEAGPNPDGGGQPDSSGPAGGGTWIKLYNVNPMESPNAIVRVQDGFVITGDTTTTAKSRDLWVLKIDPSGAPVWGKSLGDVGWDEGVAIANVGGKLLVAAYLTQKSRDFWMLQLDGSGTLEWEKTVGGDTDATKSDMASAMLVKGSDVVVVGGSDSYSKTKDVWVVGLDLAGAVKWQKRLGGSDTDIEDGQTVASTPSGFLVAATAINFQKSDMNAWLLSFDSAGKLVWQKSVGGAKLDRIDALIPVDDGMVCVGSTKSTGKGEADVWVMKIDFDGKILWQKTIGGAKDDWGSGATRVKDGVVIVGRTESFGTATDDSDIWVLKVDDSGKLSWSQRIGRSTHYDSAQTVVDTGDGVLLAGFSEDNDTGDSDWIVAKLDYQGQVDGGCANLQATQTAAQDSNLASADTSVTPADTQAPATASGMTAKDAVPKSADGCK